MRGDQTFDQRYNSFFVDYSLVPLLVQQNYIECAKAGAYKATQDEVGKVEAISKMADAVADMELVGSSLMGADQHWELLPAQAVFTCRVGALCNGFQAFPTFPQWLGKNSTTSKLKRMTNELVYHTLLQVGQGFSAVRLEYVMSVNIHIVWCVGCVCFFLHMSFRFSH